MSKLFLSILNMSLTASIMIAIVLLARLCLRKAPKIYSYILWSVVLFRLLCPVAIAAPASVLSLFSNASQKGASEYTASMQYISPAPAQRYEFENAPAAPDWDTEALPDADNITVAAEDTAPVRVEAVQPEPKRSAKEIALTVCGWIWIAGFAAFLGYTALQYIFL